MKIAVTGSTGFIGSALVRRLAEQGHSVLALARRPEVLQSRLPPGVSAGRFDAAAGLAPSSLAGIEAVVHLAGENIGSRWSEEQKARILRSRVEGTLAIARAAAQAGVKTLISASAVGYYGPRGSEPLTEVSPPGDDFLARVCLAWEQATAPARDAGARTACLRMGIVLHPGGGALARMLPLFRLGLGGRLGSGAQYLSWIHLDDLLSLILHVLEHQELEGPINATTPEPVTNREFTLTLARALRRPARLPVPAWVLRLALGEMSSLLLCGQRVLPRKAVESGFTFRYPKLLNALEGLAG